MTTDTEHDVSSKGKRIRLKDGEKVFVGADVHRKTYAVAMWSDSRGMIHRWTQPAAPDVLVRRLEPIRGQVQRVVYEAGPTGYSLVRTLRAAGFNADVIATSLMLRIRNPLRILSQFPGSHIAETRCADKACEAAQSRAPPI
jgi:transposase